MSSLPPTFEPSSETPEAEAGGEEGSDGRAGRMRQVRRQQILHAAKEVFAERGYHDTSISDIIGRAQIARGTFYLYFSSKQKIFDSILEEALRQLRSRLSKIDIEQGAPPPQVQLRGSLIRVMEYVLGDPHFTRLLLRSSVGPDGDAAERVDAFYSHAVALIQSSLEHGIEMGLVRPCDTGLVAAALIGAARGIVDHVLDQAEPPAISALVDELIAFALRGVVVAGRW